MLKNSKRLCVFAHFNPQFRVAEYVFYYLQRLHDDVNADIIFSSTSAIPTADRARLEALCLYIVIRKNQGYDFGSWQDGLHALSHEQLLEYDEIIIANDSCYGPLVPFTEMWEEMDKRILGYNGLYYLFSLYRKLFHRISTDCISIPSICSFLGKYSSIKI